MYANNFRKLGPRTSSGRNSLVVLSTFNSDYDIGFSGKKFDVKTNFLLNLFFRFFAVIRFGRQHTTRC